MEDEVVTHAIAIGCDVRRILAIGFERNTKPNLSILY